MDPKMKNRTEKEEHAYLQQVLRKVEQAIDISNRSADLLAGEVKETTAYMWENKAEMDGMEKLSVRKSIAQMALSGEKVLERKKRLQKLLQSPYFGRIDFKEAASTRESPVYIGIHSFYDTVDNENLIHDWRAPVSAMFYDFELGEASYQAPSGEVKGEITLKRQYRIRNGRMEFMLETSLNVLDDILQQELSRNTSDRMRNIVATIQRDQNAIIRNEDARTLIIQGVAGSGKTSIALHRIAFLLYRYKESIRAEDILIVSPNKVFADYISNVLPELGEEKMKETVMEDIANEILEGKIVFQSYYDQMACLLGKDDQALRERIQFKSGAAFVSRLNEYLVHLENTNFTPTDFVVKRFPIPAFYLTEKYNTYFRLPLQKRIAAIARDIVSDLSFYYGYDATAVERTQIRKEIEGMFKVINIRQIYKDFYSWLNQPDYHRLRKGHIYEYSDVFPLVYLKMHLEGVRAYDHIKHLVIDEMQDYSAIQYSVLARLFACNKTILGDTYQSVNPYSASRAVEIAQILGSAEVVIMQKSYRSTMEITQVAQAIKYNPDIQLIDRHGEVPEFHKAGSSAQEIALINDLVAAFQRSGSQSLGIICKTQQQADELYYKLAGRHERLVLLNPGSTSFSDGAIIATAYLSKGLEFDQVIIPFCSLRNYESEMDRQMLYVGVTRALHKLTITYTKSLSRFLEGRVSARDADITVSG